MFPATGAIFTQNEVNIGISHKISPFGANCVSQKRWSTWVSKISPLRNRNVWVVSETPKLPKEAELKGISDFIGRIERALSPLDVSWNDATSGGMIGPVTMSCADCGCVVARGQVVHSCDSSGCCCEDLPRLTMESLAAEIRLAMESADLEVMGELLAPDARWGAPEQDVPTCRNAKQVLKWYEVGRDNGLRAEVTETEVIGENIVIGFKILTARDGTSAADDALRWQVLSTKDGRVAEIRGYETRREATEFATSGVSTWRSS